MLYTYDSYYYRRAALFECLPTDTTDIIMLGNSLTDGCEWHELMQDNRIKNRGITADVVAGIKDRLPAIIKGRPAQIFIMAGINDISHDLSADSISGMIWDIVSQIRQESPSTGIYVQSLLPVNTNMGYKRLQGERARYMPPQRTITVTSRHLWISLHRLIQPLRCPGQSMSRPAIYQRRPAPHSKRILAMV